MSRELLMRFNLEIITPEPWTQKDDDFDTSWGRRPLTTTLSVRPHSKGKLYISVYVGPFKGIADAEVFDEIPAALRRAYVMAIRDARGTESEPQMMKDVALAPRWLRDGLRRALDAEVREAHLEVSRLAYAKGHAEYQHEKAVASRALLPVEPKP
jgi:hypothetical protein